MLWKFTTQPHRLPPLPQQLVVQMQSLSDRLHRLKQVNKLTSDDIACTTGVTRRTVQSWLCGETLPKSDKLLVLAHRLGTTTDYLLGGDPVEIDSRAKEMFDIMKSLDKEDRALFIQFAKSFKQWKQGG